MTTRGLDFAKVIGFLILVLNSGVLLADSTAVGSVSPYPHLHGIWQDWWKLCWDYFYLSGGVLIAVIVLAYKAIRKYMSIENRLNSVESRLNSVDSKLTEHSGTTQKNFDRAFDLLEKVMLNVAGRSGALESKSPRVLTARGVEIFEGSGVKDVVESRISEFAAEIGKTNPANAYRAELALIELIQKLSESPEHSSVFEKGAFNYGETLETMVLIAATGIRNEVFEQLHLDPKDIDVHAQSNE